MAQLMNDYGLLSPARIVHVVGTNGKGTVSAMIEAGLTYSGLRTGLFISPHVEDYRERISVSGERISAGEVSRFVQQLQHKPVDAAFFELSLLLALRHFQARQVETLVLEAGV